jgi:hypothetical protein
MSATKAFQVDALHKKDFTFEEYPVYGWGRPCANETRTVKGMRYVVVVKVSENSEAIEKNYGKGMAVLSFGLM